MNKKFKNSNTGGFSLIEVIVAMALLAAVYSTLFKVLSNQKIQVIKTELTTKGIFLGQELMNRILAKDYDENNISPWTAVNFLGQETQETNYDDVDDFNNYSNSSINEFPGFTQSAEVYYVDPVSSLDNAVAYSTDMKKIVVTVTHNEMTNIVLETLISSHY